MPTIKDVAKAANVSVATVSRVLNNENVVKEETKKAVLGVIESLNYSPNMLGRNLRRLQTDKVLVLLDTISNQYYSQVVKGIEEKASELGYSVMICMTHGNEKIEQRYIDMIKTKLFDGVIFLNTVNSGKYLSNELKGVPAVQASEPKDSFNTPRVCIDNVKAGFDAATFLIENGHEKIAFFGAGNSFRSSIERREGYLKALKENSIKANPKWIIEDGFSYTSGERCAKKLVSSGEMPTAVFAASDSCAVGAVKYLSTIGISVPKDISFMGFDNTKIAQLYNPSITTIKQPQVEIGINAMQLLAEKMDSKVLQNKSIILKHSIIVRESVKRI